MANSPLVSAMVTALVEDQDSGDYMLLFTDKKVAKVRDAAEILT